MRVEPVANIVRVDECSVGNNVSREIDGGFGGLGQVCEVSRHSRNRMVLYTLQ